MESLIQTATAWLVVTGSCVLWIGGVTLTISYFFELSAQSSWAVASLLGAFTLLALLFIAYELRNALELPNDVEFVEFFNHPVPTH